MRPADHRFRDAGRSAAGGTPAVPSRSAGVPPAFKRTAADADATWRSRGYLPHFDTPELVQHIVFRLADSLPAKISEDIAPSRHDDCAVAFDAVLDAGHGRRDLARPEVGGLVQAALISFDGARYRLGAWCVMPNHVHVLAVMKSGYGLDRIVHSWKSYTAKEANRVLCRVGRFWAPEYFDRFMRDDEHLARTAAYIEGNPVKAGLCESVGDWQFSSAWRGWGGRDARGPEIHP